MCIILVYIIVLNGDSTWKTESSIWLGLDTLIHMCARQWKITTIIEEHHLSQLLVIKDLEHISNKNQFMHLEIGTTKKRYTDFLDFKAISTFLHMYWVTVYWMTTVEGPEKQRI